MAADELTLVQVAPIASVASKGSGDYVYRIGQPAEAMGRLDGVTVVNISHISPYLRQMCLAADVLVLHLVGEVDLLPIVAERKRRGLATVYEISDNFMAFPKSASIREWFQDPLNLATTFQLIQMADAIQGVSEVLLRQFKFLHDDFVVFENHVKRTRKNVRTHRDFIRIGWGGSVGHGDDVAYVASVIKEVCRNNPHTEFCFMGNRTQFEKTFGDENPAQFLYVPPGSMEKYYAFVQGLDIGLAPMLETPYNACRSDVKFIEYGCCGVVPVLSAIAPYCRHARHGVNALLFNDRRSLKDLLNRLVNDPQLLEAVGRGALEYVRNQRLERDHAARRVSFYSGLVRHRSEDRLPFDVLGRVSPDTSVLVPTETASEKKVLEGFLADANGDSGAARMFWEEASGELPGYAFPLLCLGRSLLAAGNPAGADYLEKALKCDPKSLRARLLFGQAFRRIDIGRAAREFDKALSVFPDFAPAWKELALIEKRSGNMKASAGYMNKALEVNPFYADAAFELGKIYEEQQTLHLAVEAFRVAANLISEKPEYQYHLMEALAKQGNLAEAAETGATYLDGYDL